MATVRELMEEFGPEFMDLDAAGLVMIAVTRDAPMVASTQPPDLTCRLLAMILDRGHWSDTTVMGSKPN